MKKIFFFVSYRSIFSSISDVKLEETRAGPVEPTDEIGFQGSGGLRSTTPHSRAKTSSVLSAQNRGETPPKIDKRLTQVYVSICCQAPAYENMKYIYKYIIKKYESFTV